MRSPAGKLGWVLVAVVPVSACSDGDHETRDPTTIVIPENIAESEFASLINEIGCNAVAPCCAEVGYEYDAGTCSVTFANTFGLYLSEGLGFDGVMATACLRALQKDTVVCGSLPAACRKVYRGTSPLGGSCGSTRECEATPGQNVTCDVDEWTCKVTTMGDLGDPCDQTCETESERAPGCLSILLNGNAALPANTHVACDRARGLYCDRFSATCEPLADLDSSCKDSLQCAVGSTCGLSNSPVFTCQELAAVGGPCSVGIDCAGDAYCDTNGTCRTPQTKADGESCTRSIECAGECTGNLCTGAIFADGFSAYDANAICGRQKNL